MSGYHVYCLTTNTTTIEGWEKGTALTMKSHSGKISDVSSTTTIRGIGTIIIDLVSLYTKKGQVSIQSRLVSQCVCGAWKSTLVLDVATAYAR